MAWSGYKYRNKKVEVDGIKYDSIKESARHQELKLLEKAGEIKNLQRQVKYVLIPAQKNGKKTVEQACTYIADFVYTENGQTVVEDTKGFKTREYIIKRKLMLYIHNIQIREI